MDSVSHGVRGLFDLSLWVGFQWSELWGDWLSLGAGLVKSDSVFSCALEAAGPRSRPGLSLGGVAFSVSLFL